MTACCSTRPTAPTAARRSEGADRRRTSARADGVSRRRLQSLRSRRNYLGRYAPHFFTEAQTPWGSAIDYRVPEVRAFAIDNALYWLRDYRFDGLRLDAVHAIVEPGEPSMLHDLSLAVGELAERPAGTSIWCWRTTTTRRACSIRARSAGGKYRAQWNDDYHHAWHVLLTGEKCGYYRDYQTIAASRYRARARLRLRLSGRDVGASRRQPRGEPCGICRRPLSSISCRTTTRSATAPSVTGWRALADPRRSKPRSR